MNANEVIAELAGDEAHPNDHVNMGQSSNDVFPSAVHLAALGEVHSDLLPALDELRAALERKADEFADLVKAGPHPPDGRRAGDARAGVRGLRRPDPPRGGARPRHARPRRADPARRHRDRDRPQHPPRVRRQGAREAQRRHRARHLRARRSVRGAGEPRRARRALRSAQDGGRLAAQDRQRPGADGVRAARRARRDRPARAAEGLLDHARQGQPGDPRGRHPGRRPGGRQRRRDHAGGKPGPVRAQRPGAADRPQPARLDQAARAPPRGISTRSASAGSSRTRRCSSATPRRPWRPPPRSTRTSATTGRRRSSRRPTPRAGRCERWRREMGVEEEILDEALDHRKMARPHD